jgi:ankyrin repeat protein
MKYNDRFVKITILLFCISIVYFSENRVIADADLIRAVKNVKPHGFLAEENCSHHEFNSPGHKSCTHLHHVKHHVEALGKDVNHADQWNHHVLKHAAHHGHHEVGEYLISKGANVNVKTIEGRTPLIAAAHQGRLEFVKLLVGNGANLNEVDHRFGYSAVMMAAVELHHGHTEKEHEDVIRFLVDQPGIDLLISGKHNKKDLLDILYNKRLMHAEFYKHIVEQVEKQKKALASKEEDENEEKKEEL